MELLLLSLAAGVLTVLAPCVLPLVPVVVGGSAVSNDRWRPYVICGSLFFTIIIFTLLLKASTVLISVPDWFWKGVSGGIVLLFGLTLLWPSAWSRLGSLLSLQSGSNKLFSLAFARQGRASGVWLGAALGPVFTSCSPVYFLILATVLPVNFWLGSIYVAAYSLGLSATLLLVALFGQKLVTRLNWAIDPEGWFKKILGIVLIAVGVAVMLGLDKDFQSYILDQEAFDVTRIERILMEGFNRF